MSSNSRPRGHIVVACLAISSRRSRRRAGGGVLRDARIRTRVLPRGRRSRRWRREGLSASDLRRFSGAAPMPRNCWVQGGEGDWLIEHVATLPEYRGRGLVQALIGHALAAGKAAGFARASISFLIGNEAAERCLRQGRLCLRRREARSGVRGADRRAGFSPVRARDLNLPRDIVGRALPERSGTPGRSACPKTASATPPGRCWRR